MSLLYKRLTVGVAIVGTAILAFGVACFAVTARATGARGLGSCAPIPGPHEPARSAH